MARSRAGFFRIDSAFPASAPGRHHIGPFGACSSFTRVTACQVARPPFCGLCREVPTRPVSQPSRSPAIESNHQLFEWVLPPLVICPFRAHAEACPTSSAEFLDIRRSEIGEHERHFYEQHEKRIYSSGERASAFGKMNPSITGYARAANSSESSTLPWSGAGWQAKPPAPPTSDLSLKM